MTRFLAAAVAIGSTTILGLACSSVDDAATEGTAGTSATEGGATGVGTSAAAGLDGMATTGGALGTAGGTSAGGQATAGGTTSSGGATGGTGAGDTTGGTTSSGGATGGTGAGDLTGGTTSSGGATGGTGSGSGGTLSGSGGSGVGGNQGSGGWGVGGSGIGGSGIGGSGIGGAGVGGSGVGGSGVGGAGVGGSGTGGEATGGETGTGGQQQQTCVWTEGPSATNGGLTCYWFAQGTAIDETTCPGGYKTYCGYCGSETGERPQGDGQVWCPIHDVVSTVQNISTTHFAAIPMGPLGNGQNCGMCVEISYGGRTITATVVDACPSCLTDEHVDLSLSAAEALGLTEEMGQVESGVAWHVVGCPASGDIQVNFNGDYQGQVYFQNLAFPIASASSDGQPASLIVGFWDFGKEMGGQEVTLTDVMGHTVTAIVPSAPGSLGVQFDLTCQ